MKKIILLLTFFVSFCSIGQVGTVFTLSRIKYKITSATTAEVTQNAVSLSGAISIPASVVFNTKSYQVTKIGADAFYDCTGIDSVSIPNSVTSVGDRAFLGCSYIASIVLPNSITSIGDEVFGYCSGLTSVTLPNSLQTISRDMFYACTNLTSLTIPETVTSIGLNAFYGCRSLNSIIIPAAVTNIGINAFYNCTSLQAINIPKAVTTIGNNAFTGCTGLRDITVNWTTPIAIDSNTFNLLDKTLLKINVPAGSEAAYKAHSVWGTLTFPAPVVVLPKIGDKFTIDGIKYIVTKETTPYEVAVDRHTTFTGVANIPATATNNGNSFAVTSIGIRAFYNCSGLASVTIPDSVTSIGNEAFYNCTGLTSVKIGNSVTSIGEGAFTNCNRLTSVTIGNSVTSIGSDAFSFCQGLTSVTIGNSVTSIGQSAFGYCSGLTSVTVNWDNPLTIHPDVFIFLTLNNVILYVPAGTVAAYKAATVWQNFNPIRVVGTSATAPTFAAVAPVCAGATIAALPTTSTNGITGTWSPAINNTATSTYTFTPNAGEDATTATLEIVVNALPNAPTSAAQNFTVASTVANLVPAPSATIKWYDAATGGTALATTTAIATGTYYVSETNANNCESTRTSVAVTVNTVVLPGIGDKFTIDGINYIVTKATAPYEVAVGRNASFVGAAVIPATATNNGNSFAVTRIASSAFSSCNGLTSVSIPNSVTSIANKAFDYCTRLISITIPNSVISIGDGAFTYCSSLSSVTIPNSVTSIGNYAFEFCDSLRSVTVDWASPLTINPNVFDRVPLSNVILYVPAGTVATYKAAAVWQNFNPVRVVGTSATAPTFAAVAPVCAGATIAALPTTSTNGITGTWSPEINNEATTTYTFTPNAGEDATTATLEIVVNALPNAPTAAAQNFTVASTVANLVPAPSASIKWYDAATGGAVLATTTALATGTYYVSETNANNCESARTSVAVTVNTVVLPAFGDTFAFEGINYIVTKATVPYQVAVGDNKTFVGAAVIPASVSNNGNAFAVTAVVTAAFAFCETVTSVVLPNTVVAIGPDAFASCSGLTAVGLADGLTTIGRAAFASCTKLTLLSIPSTVLTIESEAFRNCYGLTSVSLKEGLTTVGDSAFATCTNLKTLSIPKTVLTIGSLAFSNCDGLTSVSLHEGLTTIGNSAFAYCTNLKTLSIPKTVLTIGSQAFSNCDGLTSVSLHEGLTTIGNSAFAYCTDLGTLSIPNSVTTIEASAFEFCTGLTSVTVYRTTPLTIDANVFDGVRLASTRLHVPAASKAAYQAAAVWKNFNPIAAPVGLPNIGDTFAFDGLNYIVTKEVEPYEVAVDDNTSFVGAATIPASITNKGNSFAVTSIADYAFNGSSTLTSVVFPNSITAIGDYSFSVCENLKSVAIPNSVTSIGTEAFSGCKALASATLSNTLASLGDKSFSNCSQLISIIFPDSLTAIGAAAFSNCIGLTSLTIPNSVTAIDDFAFENCTGLTAITVNWRTPLVIAVSVFDRITLSGVTLNIPARTKAAYLAAEVWQNFNPIADPAVVIPKLGDIFAFEGFNYIVTKATAPYEVAVGENRTFVGDANIPTNVSNSGNDFMVTAIGDYAFSRCSTITTVVIPNTVLHIGSYAFAECKGLNAASIGNSVKNIGNRSFASCTSLTSITIPNSVTIIGAYAFSACSNLRTVTIPNSVSSIGHNAFGFCRNLTSVNVNWDAPLRSIGENVFYQVYLRFVTLYVPLGKLDSYKTAAVWKDFNPIRESSFEPVLREQFKVNEINYQVSNLNPLEVDVANNKGFVGHANIPQVVIYNGNTFIVTGIAAEAFQGSKLTGVSIPNTVTFIEEKAFASCSNLSKVVIPDSVTSIGVAAFTLCENLTSAILPKNMDLISTYSFAYCFKLAEVRFPDKLTNIGDFAFIQTALTSLELPFIRYIFGSAFAHCYSLNNVSLGYDLNQIENNAFGACSSLATFRISHDNRYFNFGPEVFINEPGSPDEVDLSKATLIVPAGTKAGFQSAGLWKDFGTIIEDTNFVVPTPTATNQTLCNGATVANLIATGENLKWYDVASAGTALPLNTTLTAGNYYVVQTLSGLESSRVPVAVTITTTPAPVAANQSFTASATIAQLVASGSALKWYATASGGNVLPSTTVLSVGTYYVSQTVNTCESARTAVAVSVPINYCRNAVAFRLPSPFAFGKATKWYTVATGGKSLNRPTPVTTAVGTQLFYVAQVTNGGESARETITVNTVALPLPPGTITGATSVGAFVGSNTTTTYAIENVADAVSYLWTVPTGVQIATGLGTNTVTLNFLNVSNQAGTIGNISVAAVNANGCTGTARVLALSSAIPTAPARITMTDPTATDPAKAITNISTFVGTNKVLTLTAAATATASSYQWELAPGVTQLSGGNTNTITVNFAGVNAGITSLYVGVKSVNDVGTSTTDNSTRTPATASTARILPLSATLLTGTPTVAGQIVGLCGGVSYSYTVTAVANANSYQITAPTGAIVRTAANVSNNSNSLSTSDLMFTVTYPAGFVATTAAPATLEVRAANGVGASTKSRILNLSNAMPAFKTPTGSAGITTFTRNATQTFTVADVLGATTYNWTVANGAVLVSGQGTNTITVDFSAVPVTTTSTRVTVVATNACGVSNTIRTITLKVATPTTARLAPEAMAVNTTEVYPNPIVSDFNIDVIASKKGVLEMSIYTLDGVLIRKPKTVALAEGENHLTENAAHLPTGVYILQLVNSASNAVITKKLIKK